MASLILVVLAVAIAAAIAAIELPGLYAGLGAAAIGGLAFIVALFLLRAPGVAVLPILAAVWLVWKMMRGAGELKTMGDSRSGLAGFVAGLILVVATVVVAMGAARQMPALGAPGFTSAQGAPSAAYGSANFLAILFSYRLLDVEAIVILLVTAAVAWFAIRAGGSEAGTSGPGERA